MNHRFDPAGRFLHVGQAASLADAVMAYPAPFVVRGDGFCHHRLGHGACAQNQGDNRRHRQNDDQARNGGFEDT